MTERFISLSLYILYILLYTLKYSDPFYTRDLCDLLAKWWITEAVLHWNRPPIFIISDVVFYVKLFRVFLFLPPPSPWAPPLCPPTVPPHPYPLFCFVVLILFVMNANFALSTIEKTFFSAIPSSVQWMWISNSVLLEWISILFVVVINDIRELGMRKWVDNKKSAWFYIC